MNFKNYFIPGKKLMAQEKGYSYIFALKFYGGREGIRTLDTAQTVYRFSRAAPSTTRPPFQLQKQYDETVTKIQIKTARLYSLTASYFLNKAVNRSGTSLISSGGTTYAMRIWVFPGFSSPSFTL